MNELLARIRFFKDSLPKAEKIIAQAILENPQVVLSTSLNKLAREIGSNDAAIVRFCRRLGFSGYTEFRNAMSESLHSTKIVKLEEILPSDTIFEILKKVFNSNMQSLADTISLASDSYQEALDAMIAARSIHFFGCGDAVSVCQLAFIKFSKLGIPCSAHLDPVMQLIDAGRLGPQDIAFAISYQGHSFTVNNALRTAKENGATTICITKMNKSPMLKYIDICLFIATVDLSISRDIVARRVADQMIIDALYLALLAKSDGIYDQHLERMRDVIDRNKG